MQECSIGGRARRSSIPLKFVIPGMTRNPGSSCPLTRLSTKQGSSEQVAFDASLAVDLQARSGLAGHTSFSNDH